MKVCDIYNDQCVFNNKFRLFLGSVITTLANRNPDLFFSAFKSPLNNILATTLKKIFQNILSTPETNYFID